MIIKHSPRKSGKFSNLVKYITEPKPNVEERILDAWSENTGGELGEDFLAVAVGVDFMHDQKKPRIDKDMTYHLIVSFTPDEAEKLKPEDFRAISRKIQNSLGLDSHKSISAVHGDTANPHLHIALDLINEKGHFKEPYLAYKTFQKVRGEVAKEYGFELSESKKESKDDAAVKIEQHNDMESFSTWLKANVSEQLKDDLKAKNPSWSKVHANLKKKGVEIRKHGNGLVFSHHKNKLFVKASSIDRAFSLGKLQAVLGNFQASSSKAKTSMEYKAKSNYGEAKKLYTAYQKKLEDLRAKRGVDRKNEKDRFADAKKKIWEETKASKQKVLDSSKPHKARSAELKVLTLRRLQKMEGAFQEHQTEMQKIKAKFPHQSWKDFLIEAAKRGDLQAISMLQAKGILWQKTDENRIFNEKTYTLVSPLKDLSVEVKASGEVIYKTKKKAEIKDRGMSLIIGDKYDSEKLEAALRLSVAKFGKTLNLAGDDKFKAAVIDKAKALKLKVEFVDEKKSFSR